MIQPSLNEDNSVQNQERRFLLKKYDIPAPRYTSYPTVPYWSDNPTTGEWLDSLKRTLDTGNASLSIYVHIPFCETLCTFCGCNTSITKNHALVENPYLDALEKEWNLYRSSLPQLTNTPIKEIHLGGGTPTYLSESNLDRLMKFLTIDIPISNKAEFSVEVDPRRTRTSQLRVLHDHGFRRISLGVQDFHPTVQKLVNRFQPEDVTKKITEDARNIGYTSVNFDLIYGLPRQTLDSIQSTIEKTVQFRPDRIAFYSYAHVPWIKSSQRLFTEEDLPQGNAKRDLYELGRSILEESGYREIGMDHFALENDSLWQSFREGRLHRNFMGYTSHKTDILLGLGTSAISETPDCFHQNEKLEIKYRKILRDGHIPTLRGHKLNPSDIRRRSLVLEFMNTWKVYVPDDLYKDVYEYLRDMQQDGLVEWEDYLLKITEKGRPFLRIACTAFDEKLRENKPDGKLFSKAI